MIGSVISHYKILEKIGEGGMGVVYKAHDTRLERDVALKFLPQHLTANASEQARFLQEAKTVAQINHPNVCSIIDIGDSGNQQFFVMEFIDGKTLRQFGGKLDLQTAMDYAIQVADGLQAAHLKGIVHRDVKSENIMVTADGRIKVMDFGLAKLKGSLRLTKTSSTVGTLAYMAPEQVQGKEADARSDIFSFGVVLFETLTGQLPFRGEHEAAIMYSIVNEGPEPIQKYMSDASPELVHILNKTLEKDPSDRYQSIGDLLVDLRRLKRQSTPVSRVLPAYERSSAAYKSPRWIIAASALLLIVAAIVFIQYRTPLKTEDTSVSPTKAEPSPQLRYKLAILPFRNLGGDQATNFLGFALADNIITNLSYVKSIVVRPSSSVAQYKDADPVPEQVAKSLDVNVMLTGNYVKEGGDLHLNAQLVDLGTNSIIWQKPLDVKYTSIISLQKSITDEIIKGLQLSLTSGEQSRISTTVPRDPQAYEAFLRGKSLGAASDVGSLRRAIGFFDDAINREPSFAPAYAEKGYALIYLGILGGDTASYRGAESALSKALAIDSTLTDALSHLAQLYIERTQKERAYPLLRHAVELSPNVSDIHDNLSYFYRLCGLCEKAEREAGIAQSLNPADRRAYLYRMYSFHMRGRFDEAIAIGREGLRHVPYDSQILVLVGSIYYFEGILDSLNRYSTLASQADPQGVAPIMLDALVRATRGDSSGSVSILDRMGGYARSDMEFSFWMSFPYAQLGMKREAIYWLNAAIDEGLDGYPWLAHLRVFDKFRNDLEFKTVSEKMRSHYERLGAIYGPDAL